VASIIRMSHCLSARGFWPGAWRDVDAERLTAARSAAARSAAAMKPVLLDLTVATPTWAFSFRRVPPAALTAARAAAVDAPSA
jgi:hypothetical protein